MIDVDALNAACEKIKEAFSIVTSRVGELAEAIEQLFSSAYKKIEEQQRNRTKWLRNKNVKLQSALLDRRMTVHRCRNCC